MNIEYRRVTDPEAIYNYYLRTKELVPYWFDVDYELWKESFLADTDYDGEEMFSELAAYIALSGEKVVGFIQFGISRYIYGTDGEKDHSVRGGVIRHLYFDRETDCGKGLVEIAFQFFHQRNIERRFAFFHAFGMTCCAGHGKLHRDFEHIEAALAEFGYIKEHENVYYRRMLTENDCGADTVAVNYGSTNPKGLCEFSITLEGEYVGAGALVYLPQGKIAYLKWIYIEGVHQGKGLAAAALRQIFADLYAKGILRMDTDTADGNLAAQRLYTKTGFEDMGRTRSYIHQEG